METSDVAELVLPKGEYLLTFSFFTWLDNQWLYAGLKTGSKGVEQLTSRTIPFESHQGFYGMSNQWIPVLAKQKYRAILEENRIVFELFSGSSYGSKSRNFLMTAEKIDGLE